MKITDLIVTQCGLRKPKQLKDMVLFVDKGGFFNEESLKEYSKRKGLYGASIIKIAKFEDGGLYVEDGHHRIVSIVLSGRDYLREDEYQIVDWEYKDFQDINLECGWVTPYDPRTEFRLAELSDFKYEVRKRLKTSSKCAINYIRNNEHEYKKFREYDKIRDLIRDLIG